MIWHTEVRKISELKNWESNPRTISEESYNELKKSIGDLGNFEPLVINIDGTVLAGNQRLRVHKEQGDTEVEVSVPERELTEQEIKKIGLISNRHSGEWDMDKLANEFEDVLEELGFDDLMPEVELDVKEDGYEEPEELPIRVKLGEVWQLGKHRLMCGDSTKIEDVEKLMNGQKADMVFTDPPYGMGLDTDYSKLPSTKAEGNRTYSPVMGDDKPFNHQDFHWIDCKEQVWFGANYYAKTLPDGGSWLVWDKRVEERFDDMFGSGFEIAWSRTPHKQKIYRHNNTLFGGDVEARGKQHPTQKPTKLCGEILDDVGNEDDLVLDLFGGSGSTLIACEQTNRVCYMMELDEHYATVIVDRWEKLTGGSAIKLE